MLNDIYDEEIDRVQNRKTPVTLGVDKKFYLRFGAFIALFSVLLSIYIGLMCFLLNIIFLFLGFVYSSPPIRIRKYPLSTSFIGIGAVIAFLMGYTPTEINSLIMKMIFILFVATTIGTNVKDLKDYEGDKRAGIKTLFTVFGKENGKKISSLLLFFSLLSPIILLPYPFYVGLFILLAVLSVVIFQKTEEFRLVIIIVLFMFILSVFGVLNSF